MASNSKLEFESGQNFNDFTLMDDSGDHKVFTVSGGKIFSGKSGYEVDLRPNGIITGLDLLTPSATNNVVNVAAFTAYSKGVEHLVSAGTATVVRPTGDNAKIDSITMDDSGAIAVVEGTEGSGTTFSETRGENGGPPLIPVDSVEIGQVRMTANAAAVISATEIKQVIGVHAEAYDFPTWKTPINTIGDGLKATVSARKNAHIEFDDELPLIHTGVVGKRIYISWSTPIFAETAYGKDFSPAENTVSQSSEEYYGNKTLGEDSLSLGTASYTVALNDGITDSIKKQQDEIITHRFWKDRNKTAYSLTQGRLALKTSNPTGRSKAEATIAPSVPTANFAS